ncbi:hypothetical protein JRQ81_001074 [Phrynocephalus forsythii]|uniref:Uncharacterized protein n=1 Tax=Phrynocephalus forsythii TaxID=171643 RepID=A0A9Q0Y6F8_9SAUR|nr:hypothetical protein JRQ81_001074 [Phrynocephalus forsythii]
MTPHRVVDIRTGSPLSAAPISVSISCVGQVGLTEHSGWKFQRVRHIEFNGTLVNAEIPPIGFNGSALVGAERQFGLGTGYSMVLQMFLDCSFHQSKPDEPVVEKLGGAAQQHQMVCFS